MKTKKIIIISVISLLLLTGLFMTVYAILYGKSSDSVENVLRADSESDPTITETFESNRKTDVKVVVPKTGYSVFVRGLVVVNWKNSDGEIYSVAPVAGTDYTITLNTTDWFLKDGYYYHKAPVVSEGSTSVLVSECVKTSTSNAPEGYFLSVEILAQTIQAIGTTDEDDNILAVTNAWGVTVDSNGNLTNQ